MVSGIIVCESGVIKGVVLERLYWIGLLYRERILKTKAMEIPKQNNAVAP